MTASLETLVIAAYVFADDLLIPRPGPAGKITDGELVALAVAQAAVGVPSDRQFLGLVAKLLPGWFPHLPDQTQYNRRLRRLTPSITRVQQQVAELVEPARGAGAGAAGPTRHSRVRRREQGHEQVLPINQNLRRQPTALVRAAWSTCSATIHNAIS